MFEEFTKYEFFLHATVEALLETTFLAVRSRFDRHFALALAPASNLLQTTQQPTIKQVCRTGALISDA